MCLANELRFCGGARRGPRVPQRIYSARAEVVGPDRSKRGLGCLVREGQDGKALAQ